MGDDFVGISETPEGLQDQIEKALEYTRTWRVAATVKKSVGVVCNEDEVNPVNSKWKLVEDDLPIENQYTYLGVVVSKECSWHTYIAKVTWNAKAQVDKMHSILNYPHLDTTFIHTWCVLMNVFVPKLEYAG